MTLTELIEKIRFLFSDLPTSNQIMRESLLTRPGNVIDGNNKIFILLNRRISGIAEIYDNDGVIIPVSEYIFSTTTGKITFTTSPTRPLFVDYYWLKLTDEEIGYAISLAQAKLAFDITNIPDTYVDALTYYSVGFCFLSAASMAAEYYTLSAGGKQVSKSELFNHYTKQSETFLAQGEASRKDIYTHRGERDIPSAEDSHCGWATPYFPEDGGF